MNPKPSKAPSAPGKPEAPKAPKQTEAEKEAAATEAAEKKQARYEKAMDDLAALVVTADSDEWKKKLEKLPCREGICLAGPYAIKVEKGEYYWAEMDALRAGSAEGEKDTFIRVIKEGDERLVKIMLNPELSYLIVDQSLIVEGAPILTESPKRMSPDKIEEIEQFANILRNIIKAVDKDVTAIEEKEKMKRLEKAGGF